MGEMHAARSQGPEVGVAAEGCIHEGARWGCLRDALHVQGSLTGIIII